MTADRTSAPEFDIWSLVTRTDVVKRALKFAVVVGTILIIINHGAPILRGEWSIERIVSICLTYCVPYAVTTFASVQAIRGEHSKNP